MLVVDVQRDDVLVQFRKFPADVVPVAQSQFARHGCIVAKVAPAIGQVAVGIGITGIPVQPVIPESMFAGKLAVVSRAAAVIVFGALFTVTLRADPLPESISLLAQLVEDVFQFETMVVLLGP